ncbi:hypothetical protein L9F63_010806, partial [Diploptera punctata]
WEKRRKRPTTLSPDSRGKNLKNIGIPHGRRGENIPQHFPRLPREKPEEYRDPAVEEEEKTSHNIFPDSRGKNLKNIRILQWEKRRKRPTIFSPTPEVVDSCRRECTVFAIPMLFIPNILQNFTLIIFSTTILERTSRAIQTMARGPHPARHGFSYGPLLSTDEVNEIRKLSLSRNTKKENLNISPLHATK